MFNPSIERHSREFHVVVILAPVVQTLDGAIHRINYYPAGKYLGNQLRHPLDQIYPVDSAIQRLNNRGRKCTKSVLHVQSCCSVY